jgi:hypothetical protein
MAKIEKCSCEESVFLRDSLDKIQTLCVDETPVDAARFAVVEVASEALGDPLPGGEFVCSCTESLHLRRALRACFSVCQDDGADHDGCFGLVDDLAQCSNFAEQGLRLRAIVGDSGVYDARPFIPIASDFASLYLKV